MVFPPDPSPKNAAAPGRREEERVVSCLFVNVHIGLNMCHNLVILLIFKLNDSATYLSWRFNWRNWQVELRSLNLWSVQPKTDRLWLFRYKLLTANAF